ncbi:Hypothetical protein NTJ_12984 [Nesidiocoris tenuis]|uniref:Spaetzle domain-containing protein n=1 Tax=Nesidiocoris tenuis TaxID=355587 RepID=A0ABN7B6Y5_9HEMI|nr:Hypothetical protein NTJ_12984 [Nesidiocoris tenuis]
MVDLSKQTLLDDTPSYERYKIAKEPSQQDVPQLAYEPLCHSVKKRVEMSDYEFEYEPSHYVETICTKIGQGTRDLTLLENRQMCNIPGFDCVQRKTEITFLRRRKGYGLGIWEPYSLAIPSHCECMLPKIE